MEKRSACSKDYFWNLDALYSNKNNFKQDINLAKKYLKEIVLLKDTFLNNEKNLLNYLKTDEKLCRTLDKLSCYVNLLHDEDTTICKNMVLVDKINLLITEAKEKTAYFLPALFRTDLKVILNYCHNNDELRIYEVFFKDLYRFKKHTLSEKEEVIISSLSNVINSSEEVYGLLTNSDLVFPDILDKKNKSYSFDENNYNIYIRSKDQVLRKNAFNNLYNTYSTFQNTLAKTLVSNTSAISKINKLRGYSTSIEAALFDNNIEYSVYDNLITTISNNLQPLYDYYQLKKEKLKLHELHLYDLYVDLIENKSFAYSFNQAKDIIIKALSILGEDYIEHLLEAFNNKWIDVYPNIGKRKGAYSGGSYDTYPYILLNYNNQLDDVLTLAHEAGHSLHSYYTRNNNPYIYGSYKIFVAEVASTVNELLVAKYLLNNSCDIEEKKFVLNNLLELFKGTIYRQTMFSEFEQWLYQKIDNDKALTADELNKKYLELNKKYMGNNVVIDDLIKHEWERIPHFYYNFYVYKYATGLSAACYIVNRILNKEDNAVNDYLNFLKEGNKSTPIESLKIAGVDMNDKKVIESATMMFQNFLNEFRNLIK